MEYHPSSLMEIGRIARAHGVQGDLKVRLSEAYTGEPGSLNTVFLESGSERLPYPVAVFRRTHAGEALLRFAEVHDRNEAEALKGKRIFVTESDYISETEEDELSDWMGVRITSVEGTDVGVVKDILHVPHQELLVVERGSKEVLIPLRLEFIREWTPGSGHAVFELPDGILDL